MLVPVVIQFPQNMREPTFRRKLLFLALLLALSWFGRDGARASGFSIGVPPTVQVLTANADNYRDGWYSQERILTTSNVAAGSFGKLYTWDLTGGRTMAQLLIVPGVITSSGQKDLLIVVGLSGTISAFDANNWSQTPIWSVQMATGYGYSDELLYDETVACLSTPVAGGGYLYVVCANSNPQWVLVKLNLATGATAASATVTGQYPGTGDPAGGDTVIDGELQFKASAEIQRAALTLANGNVYVATGSNADAHPWHGWAFAFNASTLSLVATFCTSPSSYGAGLWGAGGGFSVDASGNLYVFTGNGGYDGSTAFGQSILKFSSSLSLLDWFTPADWATMEGNDSDMSSSRAMLMVTMNGSPLIVGGAKDYNAYSVNSGCMGHLQGSGPSCPSAQIWLTSDGPLGGHDGIYGGAFANGIFYAPNTYGTSNANFYAYQFSGSSFNTTPLATSSATFAFPGAQFSFSSNGALNGILWATTCATSAEDGATHGTLRAFNPTSLAQLYSSDALSADEMGDLNKYAAPVIWRGFVFVGSGSDVLVYGLGAH